jgi:hypothetical protein
MDYLEGVLDIVYAVRSDGEYVGAEILVGFGGPNVWIDTRRQVVRVAWWSAPVERDLPEEFCEGLDDALSELWSCR